MAWYQSRTWIAVKKEFPKTLLSIAVSGLGFLLALAVNQWIGRIGEKETYDDMLKTINSELAYNRQIYETSYTKYLSNGLIFREYSYSAVSQVLANPLFSRYSSDDESEILNAYIRDISMANSYRRVAENAYFNPPQNDPNLTDRVVHEWCRVLDNLPKDFSNVSRLKPRGSTAVAQVGVAKEPALVACKN
jgi:hypothetical protein